MENELENTKKSGKSSLKAIVVVLSLLLLGSGGYIYKLISDNNQTVNSLTTEKNTLASELKAKIAEYDVMIADNTALKEEIQAEQSKMVQLLEELEKSKGDVASMTKFKSAYFKLKAEMDNLVAENKLLKEQNVTLTSSLDSTKVVLNETQKVNDTLAAKNKGLSETVEKAAKLSVLNLKVYAVKQKGSGKQVETDKASRANKLKISFLIAENIVAKSGDRDYYVQIMDNTGNILGDKITVPVGTKSLTYSFKTTVEFENETVKVDEELSGKDFAKGTYYVNVYDKNMVSVSQTSFSLK